jgi:putative Ca2+/H+ antiporter (TMEM165/GDT1 family)
VDWNALFSTLGLIFVAELGDKTQLAVITQTCKFRRPWPVFLGASLALVLVTLIGALVGELLGRLIPPDVLRYIAGAAFVVMGGLIAREALAAPKGETLEEELDCPSDVPDVVKSRWSWRAFGSTLGLLFLAELGDKTQLSVLTLAGQFDSPMLVFAGGALALVLVTALGVIGGQGLCRVIPERLLLGISAVAFVVIGLLMILGVL